MQQKEQKNEALKTVKQQQVELQNKRKEFEEENIKDGINYKNKNLLAFDKPRRIKAKSTAKALPYKKMHPNDILELLNGKFSKTYRLSDINYLSATEDDREQIMGKYALWLNSLSSDTLAQISIINHALDDNALKEAVLIPPMPKVDDEFGKTRNDITCPLFGVDLTSEHNDILKGFLEIGANYCRRDKYLSITIMAANINEANKKFIDIENDTNRYFRQMALGGGIKALTNNEKTRVLAEIYRGNYVESKNFQDWDFDFSNEKSYIAPDSIKNSNSHLLIDEQRYVKTIFLREMPAELADELISDICDLGIEMNISINVKPVDLMQILSKDKAFESIC